MPFQKGNQLWKKSRGSLGKVSPFRKASDFDLIQSYAELKNIWKVAKLYGMCGQSVWERLKRRGIIIDDRWTLEQDGELIKLHQQRNPILSLEEIAIQLNRTRVSIASRAHILGITDYKRPKTEEAKSKESAVKKEWHKFNEHPKGMLGKKLTKEAKDKISLASRKTWRTKTKEQIELEIEKRLKTKGERGNLLSKSSNVYSKSKKGKRIDLNNIYFRSKTEANYARYLNFIKHAWEYEPKTFYFSEIKRGQISYTPDFYDKTEDRWIEIKGWFQPKAITKIKRFKKYFPDEYKKLKIVTQSKKSFNIAVMLSIPLIDNYESIEKRGKYFIPNWE
jgi:hypothetical protein